MPPSTKYLQAYAWFLTLVAFALLFLPERLHQKWGLVIGVFIIVMIPFLIRWQIQMNAIMRQAEIGAQARIEKMRKERDAR